MIAMILAAGLGTRLKPWTLSHPKALVPVDGVPMLERVIRHMEKCGFDKIIINVHHFSEQIVSFISSRDNKISIRLSDESNELLDTGGGILQASKLFGTDYPVLIHNVDIISNADLNNLIDYHVISKNDITLLTSDRDSSRKLLFDKDGDLIGWKNKLTGEVLPNGFEPGMTTSEEAFSGIYVLGEGAVLALKRYGEIKSTACFPIMDFLLSFPSGLKTGHFFVPGLKLLDIGKPATLERASEFLRENF